MAKNTLITYDNLSAYTENIKNSYAPKTHSHSYLNLTGGTLSGCLTIESVNWNNQLKLVRKNNGANWGPSISFYSNDNNVLKGMGNISMQDNKLYIEDVGGTTSSRKEVAVVGHTHGNISSAGTIAGAASRVVVTDSSGKITSSSTVTTGELDTLNVISGNTSKNSFSANRTTSATSNYSFAEGYQTKAIGIASHTEGSGTTATGQGAHAEGFSTYADGNYSHAEGYETIAVGGNAHAEGYNTKAIGEDSHAEGCNTRASGNTSHAEGNLTKAIDSASHAEGSNTIASGYASHAEGVHAQANNYASHAEGAYTQANGFYSHAEGAHTQANGNYSHTEGYNTNAIGEDAHAEGYNTQAIGNESHAEGEGSIANGHGSHAEGWGTYAGSDYSHAEGTGSHAEGDYSHAEGDTTQAIGIASHTEGISTIANSSSSHAEGNYSETIGDSSHAEGDSTLAYGHYSHAEGYGTQAIGVASHAEGVSTVAYMDYSHACGRYNLYGDNDALFTIGNGEDEDNRNNAFAIDSLGNGCFAGDVLINAEFDEEGRVINGVWVSDLGGGGSGDYAPKVHTATTTTYGVGTTSAYGHVKISNGDVATVASANGLAAGMDHSHSNYAPKVHTATTTTYGVGTTSAYGHVKLATGDCSSTYSNGIAASSKHDHQISVNASPLLKNVNMYEVELGKVYYFYDFQEGEITGNSISFLLNLPTTYSNSKILITKIFIERYYNEYIDMWIESNDIHLSSMLVSDEDWEKLWYGTYDNRRAEITITSIPMTNEILSFDNAVDEDVNFKPFFHYIKVDLVNRMLF
jgi:hypothetical protein